MQCPTPLMISSQGKAQPIRCGQCKPCRIFRQQSWLTRLYLEHLATQRTLGPEASSFLTLTYDPDHLPESPSLMKRDLQLFLKRYRRNTQNKIRYFCIGELGGRTNRLHAHMLIFGHSVNKQSIRFVGKHAHYIDPVITANWQKGFTLAAPVTRANIRYTSRYTLKAEKKGTHLFSISSKVPPIGVPGLELVAKQFQKHPKRTIDLPMPSANGEATIETVESELTNLRLRTASGGVEFMPLDSTMRTYLHKMGLNQTKPHVCELPQEVTDEQKTEWSNKAEKAFHRVNYAKTYESL